jgi:hypothetical protein
LSDSFDEEQFKNALTEWLRNNYNAQVEIETIGAGYPSGTEAIMTKIKIILNPIGTSSSQKYMVIDTPLETITFNEGYSQKEIGEGTYLPLEDAQQTIEFYVLGDKDIESLGIYLLPSLTELQSEGYSYQIVSSNESKIKKVLYFGLGGLLVLLIIIVTGLQYWYRTNYEKTIFNTEDQLFNIMTFMYNSEKSGVKEGDARKNLLTKGWSREQISYASGRLKGRVLGLFGLPIYSSHEQNKVKEEIETRQRPINSRKL